MPTVLSKDFSAKMLGREWSFGYNCYEVGHTWTPSCTDAALEVSTAAAINILPLYSALYLFSQVAIQQKLNSAASWETLKSTFRSTAFIFFHAYNGSIMGCALRRSFGRFYYRVLVCAPALLSSYLSLLIEKPARRQALAFYLLNMASEIVFRMAVTKGYFKPLRHGETLLFAASLGAWYYLLKAHGFGHDPVSAAVKVLIGREEAKSRARIPQPGLLTANAPTLRLKQAQDNDPNQQQCSQMQSEAQQVASSKLQHQRGHKNLPGRVGAQLIGFIKPVWQKWGAVLDFAGNRWLGGRHKSCPHSNEPTCLRYAIQPIPARFLTGYLIQSALKLASRPYDLLIDPKQSLLSALKSPASSRFGLFLVTLVSSGRLTSCLLRNYSQSNDHNWHGLVSGFVAGLSMLWAPRPSLSMYIMWKAVEQYYLLLAKREGFLKRNFELTVSTIYAVSAATILYTFALEPRFVRPSYMKFLDNMSNHRLHQLNRMVLDVFGTGSSVGYEDYFPDLDPKYMSNQFKELVFNWMIQPYE